jgi:hypothetical protein
MRLGELVVENPDYTQVARTGFDWNHLFKTPRRTRPVTIALPCLIEES